MSNEPLKITSADQSLNAPLEIVLRSLRASIDVSEILESRQEISDLKERVRQLEQTMVQVQQIVVELNSWIPRSFWDRLPEMKEMVARYSAEPDDSISSI